MVSSSTSFQALVGIRMGARLERGEGDLLLWCLVLGQFGHSFDSVIWAHSCHALDKRIN